MINVAGFTIDRGAGRPFPDIDGIQHHRAGAVMAGCTIGTVGGKDIIKGTYFMTT
jgi:hypothetical protein